MQVPKAGHVFHTLCTGVVHGHDHVVGQLGTRVGGTLVRMVGEERGKGRKGGEEGGKEERRR